jgi:pyridoxamine 5'-phosphate oxidase
MTTDPIQLFAEALAHARDTEPFDPTTAALATADLSGSPSVRFVLVKHVDARGFVFYTNTLSRKGRELGSNPNAALAFHWHTRGEQVRIEGTVARVDDEEADRYFATRPRHSQLGAWASSQSDSIVDRAALDARFVDAENRFGAGDVPRPPHWGGYRLKPVRIEFWHDRTGRLHDRILYALHAGQWHGVRLQP